MFFIGLALAAGAMALMAGLEAAGHAADREVLRARVMERAKALGLKEDYEMVELYLPPEFDARLDAICAGRLTQAESRLMMVAVCKDLSFGIGLAKGDHQKRVIIRNKGEDPICALEGAWTGLLAALDGPDEGIMKAQRAVSSAATTLKGRIV